MNPFLVLEVSGGCFHFVCILHRNNCNIVVGRFLIIWEGGKVQNTGKAKGSGGGANFSLTVN